MVRCAMYLFLIFMACWTFYTTHHMIKSQLNTSPKDCDQTLFAFYITIIIVFNVVFGLCLVLWLSSMFAGLCYPTLFVDFFFEEDIIPVDFHEYLPGWLKGKHPPTPHEIQDKALAAKDILKTSKDADDDSNALSITDDEKRYKNDISKKKGNSVNESNDSVAKEFAENRAWMEQERKSWARQSFPMQQTALSLVPTSSFAMRDLKKGSPESSRQDSLTKIDESAKTTESRFNVEKNEKTPVKHASFAENLCQQAEEENENYTPGVRFAIDGNQRRASDELETNSDVNYDADSRTNSPVVQVEENVGSNRFNINEITSDSRFSSTPIVVNGEPQPHAHVTFDVHSGGYCSDSDENISSLKEEDSSSTEQQDTLAIVSGRFMQQRVIDDNLTSSTA